MRGVDVVFAALAVSCAVLSGVGGADAQAATSPTCLPFPRVEVRGGSRLRLDPNQVSVQVVATATRKNSTEAEELVSQAVQQLRSELESAGFTEVVSLSYSGPDLQTKWVSSGRNEPSRNVPIGYRFQETLQATASVESDTNGTEVAGAAATTQPLTSLAGAAAASVKKVNGALSVSEDSEAANVAGDGSGRAAAVDVSGFWPPLVDDGSPSDPLVSVTRVSYGMTPEAAASANLRARELAMNDAKKKADVLASTMGLTLGDLLYVTDMDSTPITTSDSAEEESSVGGMMMDAMPAYASAAAPMSRAASGPGGDPMKQTFYADVSAAFEAST